MEADRGSQQSQVTGRRWFEDPRARRLVLVGYLPWLAVLNLAWEAAHVRLYTLWNETELAYIAFAVAHCTLGDVLIGACALLLALILSREAFLRSWRWRRIAVLATILGAGYTVFSEWMNLTLLRSWTYADSMPRLRLGEIEIGLSPLLQWLVVPPLALVLARATAGQSVEQAH
jgi:hypothetical protein